MSKSPRNTIELPDASPQGEKRSARLPKNITRTETAKYVADCATELSALARQADLSMLAFLIDMARLEAVEILQNEPGKP